MRRITLWVIVLTAVLPHVSYAVYREELVFADEFDTFNPTVWSHLVTAWRGGNKEFQYYRNSPSNSYARDGILYLLPTLTADEFGEDFLYSGSLSYEDCDREPCESKYGEDIVLPIQSARIRTKTSFNFRYGRLEVRAKLPRGDWIWPAIWLKPQKGVYGPWPVSGEIDLMEARSNTQLYQSNGKALGVQQMGSTLHFGPRQAMNHWRLTHWEKELKEGYFSDDFHVYMMDWSENGFVFSVDGEVMGKMSPPEGGFWQLGNFSNNPGGPNPWAGASRMAPFDQEFYIIMNVAVGGSFFFDGMINHPYPKPWNWTSPHPLKDFWENRAWWLPTWEGEEAAMKVDYVRVYQRRDSSYYRSKKGKEEARKKAAWRKEREGR